MTNTEINEKMATEVMGWQEKIYEDVIYWCGNAERIRKSEWNPLVRVGQAMEGVRRISNKPLGDGDHPIFSLTIAVDCRAIIRHPLSYGEDDPNFADYYEGRTEGFQPAKAICLACLAVADAKKENK